jgi:predicted MFS family arabinose efflux permease
VFLPFACGYLLSYVFRTINGPLADELIRRFSLDAGALGLLTSVYFLAFAISAIPIGMALDAYGPRRVQVYLMMTASLGALVFAIAPGMPFLLVGRALIGFGVAGGLMAGLKAHALWVSQNRLPLANGCLVMFGGLGAMAATLPVSAMSVLVGWRGTFVVLSLLAASIVVALFALAPELPGGERPSNSNVLDGLKDVATDRRLLRMAPLSASVVGAAFAIQGLWAARWLTDVDLFAPGQVVLELLAMGAGLTLGAPLIGAITVWLRDRGCGEARTFSGLCLMFITLQLILQTRMEIPPVLLWGTIGAFSAMPVVSYSILGEMFAPGIIGRANSILNVLHLAAACVLQAGMGLVLVHWRADASGHYPLIAYRAAFALPLALQIAALFWFLWPVRSTDGPKPEARILTQADRDRDHTTGRKRAPTEAIAAPTELVPHVLDSAADL